MEPLISVIIPFYNGEKFIEETLQSVFDQQYKNLEIILVDDGSKKESLEILNRLKDKIKIINQENKGQAGARNTGLKIARGDIIAMLDQDDLWTKNHLSLMLPYLLDGDKYDFVRGSTQKLYIREDGTREMSEPVFHEELVGAALYKRKVIDEVGLFDEEMHEGEDFDWNIRLSETDLKEKRLPEVTFIHKRHNANLSSEPDHIKNGQILALKKKIMRAKKRNTTI